MFPGCGQCKSVILPTSSTDHLLQVVDPEVEMIDPADWDVVCDVRTPDEFAEDRMLGAINTPVLSNEQRAQVGTLYKQVYAMFMPANLMLSAHLTKHA